MQGHQREQCWRGEYFITITCYCTASFFHKLTQFLYHFEEKIPTSRQFYADRAISNVALLHTEHFLLQAIHLKGSLSTGFSQTSTRNWCMKRVGLPFASFYFRYKIFLKSYFNICNVKNTVIKRSPSNTLQAKKKLFREKCFRSS